MLELTPTRKQNRRRKPIKQAGAESGFVLKPGMHIHLVGIGGAGISAIARVLLGRGFVVSGSDQQENPFTEALKEAGATIYKGHEAAHIVNAEAIVISSAISESNPEVVAARAANIPVLKRSDFLGTLMADHIGIGVAGTHGKTTTTGMIVQILLHAEQDPTFILGGVLPSLGVNGRYGSSAYFVIEADEYDNMFLGLKPELAVITNMEHDHPDIFPTWDSYEEAFQQFAALLPKDGHLIVCGDDAGSNQLIEHLTLGEIEISTYGIADKKDTDYRALDLRPNNLGGTDFLVENKGEILGLLRLRVPGEHNVLNALAALIVGLDVGLDFIDIQRGLAEFGGVGRRFQKIGELNSVTVIDDYAHHPTEIKATLAAARQQFPGRRIWAVWQPHTFSRTKLLLNDFISSFKDADRLLVLDVYRSRETDDLGLDMNEVVASIEHENAVFVPQKEEASQYILDRIKPDDVVLTLGAGDGNRVGQLILQALEKR